MFYVHEVIDKFSGISYTADKCDDEPYWFVIDEEDNSRFIIMVRNSETGELKEYNFSSFRDNFYVSSSNFTDLGNNHCFAYCSVFGACFSGGFTLNVSPQRESGLSWFSNALQRIKAECAFCKLLCTNYRFYAEPFCEGVVVLQDFSLENGFDCLSIPKCVNALGYFCFGYNEEIKNIVISENVKYVGDDCFVGSTSLESVIFEGDLEYFGNCVFNMFGSNLKEIRLPRHIGKISNNAFYSSGGLRNTKFIIPRSLYLEHKNIFEMYRSQFGSIELVD